MSMTRPRKPARKSGGKTAGKAAIAETGFNTPFGSATLHRYPHSEKETLRAWDAADAYCLDYLSEHGVLTQEADKSVLIFNDAFGGLSIPLHDFRPTVVSDSYMSMQGIRHNIAKNHIGETDVRVVHSLQDLTGIYPDGADVVLVKIPKSNAMLDYQLHQLRDILRADSIVIAAGMTRHIHNSTMDAFANIIGPTRSTLAKKKARLIISKPDMSMEVGDCDFPVAYEVDMELPDNAAGDAADATRDAAGGTTGDTSKQAGSRTIALTNHAGVFSAAKLDLGTQLFLQHMVSDPRYRTIVDLGCGNGLLGIHAAILNAQARIVFTDESYMAVESAMANFMAQFGDSRDAEFMQTDCLKGVGDETVDLVLCNPPFHQNNIITDSIAWRMFSASRDALRQGGELWVVGNRHLAYHAKLKHLFGNCTTVASDKRFSLVKATRQHPG